MRRIILTTICAGLILTWRIAMAADVGRVLSFVIDPFNSDQAWVLSEPDLQFNPSLKSRSKWEIRFNASTFQKVTHLDPGDHYRHVRIQLSHSNPGHLFLLVETGSGDDHARFVLRTEDYGRSWAFAKVKPATSKSAVANGGVASPRRPAEQAAATVSPASPSSGGSSGPGWSAVTRTPIGGESKSEGPDELVEHFGGGPGVSPLFKVYFDLLLDLRPEVSPLSFDSYHTLFLVDLKPRPDMVFSFEVNPNPRFYELDYDVTDSLKLRAGRIWIPFDEMDPHNSFGGYPNIAALMQPGGAAFLPDFWTDLGVAAHYKFVDTRPLAVTGDVYVVNGFGTGGTDPLGTTEPYPDFSKTLLSDNNTDKALGVRLHTEVDRKYGFGVSGYTGRYTPDGAPDRRISMVGFDAQWRIFRPTRLRLGYVYMNVGLLPGANASSYGRSGSYIAVDQRLGGGWFAGLNAGSTDNDMRAFNVDDQGIVGGRIGYRTDIFQISFLHNQDLIHSPGKSNFSFTALDLLVSI